MLSVEPFWSSSSRNTTKEALPSRLTPVLSVAPSSTVILSKVIVPSFVNVPPEMFREPVLDLGLLILPVLTESAFVTTVPLTVIVPPFVSVSTVSVPSASWLNVPALAVTASFSPLTAAATVRDLAVRLPDVCVRAAALSAVPAATVTPSVTVASPVILTTPTYVALAGVAALAAVRWVYSFVPTARDCIVRVLPSFTTKSMA